ncbi:MAG TPA: hypothetical protein VMU07_00835, partial [Candidatus Paceibacterota bacterium]|nr:hypothetical protein [Candidatus Paceibacterota bacterium]
MENPFQKKSGKKGFWMVGGAVGAVLLLAVAAARFGFHGNIAENGINLAKNGGAIVADAWKNLFGSATYDASPSGNINEGGDTASDTALFDDTDASLGDGASSSSDDAYENITSVIASPKTSSKKSVSSKKSASTNPSNAAGNENATATADIGANTSTSANTNTGANTNQNMNASSSASADTSTISNADSN